MNVHAPPTRGLPDISHLFISANAADQEVRVPSMARPTARLDLSLPCETIGVAFDRRVERRAETIVALASAIHQTDRLVTVVLDPGDDGNGRSRETRRILQASHPFDIFFSPEIASLPDTLRRTDHVERTAEQSGPQALFPQTPPHQTVLFEVARDDAEFWTRSLAFCNRLVLALPPETQAFVHVYRFLKSLGRLRERRAFYWIFEGDDRFRHSQTAIEAAWQGITGRFLNTSIRRLGRIDPPPDSDGNEPARLEQAPIGLNHLLTSPVNRLFAARQNDLLHWIARRYGAPRESMENPQTDSPVEGVLLAK